MAVTRPTYVTRQQLAAAMDVQPAAGAHTELDRVIVQASVAVDTLCRRRFYPETATRVLDWPSLERGTPTWRLWLGENELISLTSLTSAGTVLTLANLNLEP